MAGQEADDIEAAIKNYELAYKMQSSVPELTEFTSESAATKELYGLNSPDPNTRNYGAQCLLARRLVERGVRFIELTCPSIGGLDRWDQHANLKMGHELNAHAVDQPIAGLLKDLKVRGLLDETLVVWTGNSVELLLRKVMMAEITILPLLVCGWQAVGSKAELFSVKQMNMAIGWLKIQ